ncbi:MAG: hypothetical protein JSU87_14630 [Gemmatimonadota bacterium]|nr:MAG: hypothetical protein JSU87_14630 [Gemmatimonadota bacterium]
MIKLLNRVALLALVIMFVAGCGDDDGPAGITIRDYITQLSTVGGASAIFRGGTPPGASGGPVVNVVGGSTGITGGSTQVTVSADADFTRIMLNIADVEGYWELTLPTSTAIGLVLTFAANPPAKSFSLLYRVANAAGAVSTPQTVQTELIEVGTGEVQVSVQWDTPTDVDLHVVEPSEEEIYYGDPSSATGGELDLDSNAACSIDGVNNENITWSQTAPRGQYIVRVDYWANCGVTANTNYVVTVRVQGRQPQTFSGSFAQGDADAGGAGSGRTITTFTF